MNRYSPRLGLLICWLFLAAVGLLYLVFTADVKALADTELQRVQQKLTTFSAVSQLIDNGGSRTRAPLGFDDLSDVLIGLSKAISLEVKGTAPQHPQIDLFIKFKHLQKLYDDREKAVIRGINYKPRKVPCKISDGESVLKCKASLKGDLADHWSTRSRMSLKIEVKGGFIYGLKNFAIQKPRTRQFPYDQGFQHMIRGLGGISSKSDKFFAISVNNEAWGVMNVEPLVDQIALEEQNVKRSGVFRIANQDNWYYNRLPNAYPHYFLSDPTVSLNIRGKEKQLLKDPILKEAFSEIQSALIFRDQKIFKREAMIRTLIASLVWGGLHTLSNSNSWYAWNAYEKNLEPVTTDQERWADVESIFDAKLDFKTPLPFEYRFIFRDKPITAEEYGEALSTIADYLKKNPILEYVNALKLKVFPADRTFTENPLIRNIEFLRHNSAGVIQAVNKKIDIKEPIKFDVDKFNLTGIEYFARAFWGDNRSIKVFNLLGHPIDVVSISDGSIELLVNRTIDTSSSENISHIDVTIPSLDFDRSKAFLITRLRDSLRKTPISYEIRSKQNRMEDSNEKSLSHDMCSKNHGSTKCYLKGNYDVRDHLEFDVPVVIGAGSNFNFYGDYDLIFQSSVFVNGTKKNPVLFQGDESGGIFVKNKKNQTSVLKNVSINGLGTTSSYLHKYTGAFNGYGGRFEIHDVSLSGSKAEDQLNLVHTTVDIRGLSISRALSDSFDCDFCDGTVNGFIVDGSGGDGLDVSGSQLYVTNMSVNDVTDKALSVGERSNVAVGRISVNNTSTAVATKDGSTVTIDSGVFDSIRNDVFMAYVKKPFYGDNTNLNIHSALYLSEPGGHKCVSEKGAVIVIEGTVCEEQNIDVQSLYKGRMRK